MSRMSWQATENRESIVIVVNNQRHGLGHQYQTGASYGRSLVGRG